MNEQHTALRLSHVPLWNRDLQWHGAVTAELRRLHEHEIANREWLSKTDWVQESASGDELGMHRADGLKRRIDRLVAENEALRAALKEAASYTRHPDYDWPVEFSRTVDDAIDAARERT